MRVAEKGDKEGFADYPPSPVRDVDRSWWITIGSASEGCEGLLYTEGPKPPRETGASNTTSSSYNL